MLPPFLDPVNPERHAAPFGYVLTRPDGWTLHIWPGSRPFETPPPAGDHQGMALVVAEYRGQPWAMWPARYVDVAPHRLATADAWFRQSLCRHYMGARVKGAA